MFSTGPSYARGPSKPSPCCLSCGAHPRMFLCVALTLPCYSCGCLIRFLGNCTYVLYAYFSVSGYFICIPAEFPANFTALVDDISACVAPYQANQNFSKHSPHTAAITAGLLQYARQVLQTAASPLLHTTMPAIRALLTLICRNAFVLGWSQTRHVAGGACLLT